MGKDPRRAELLIATKLALFRLQEEPSLLRSWEMKLSLSLALGLLFALLALASAAHPGFKVTLTESGASATHTPTPPEPLSPHPTLNTTLLHLLLQRFPLHVHRVMFLGHEADQPEFSD
jgi:hypothetical protein